MAATVILVEFDQMVFVDEINNSTELALVRALNRTADRSRTRFARAAREQVAFPASYVSPSSKRLWVRSRANRKTFETVIEGRGAATSLARFTRQKVGQKTRKGGVRVTVKPGKSSFIKRAFLMRLKNNNVGLAMRTDGSAPDKAWKPRSVGKNLWLLYGPSVDQALSAASSANGIYEELSPEMLDFLEDEFLRQVELLDGK